jgi:hypothetical protein
MNPSIERNNCLQIGFLTTLGNSATCIFMTFSERREFDIGQMVERRPKLALQLESGGTVWPSAAKLRTQAPYWYRFNMGGRR